MKKYKSYGIVFFILLLIITSCIILPHIISGSLLPKSIPFLIQVAELIIGTVLGVLLSALVEIKSFNRTATLILFIVTLLMILLPFIYYLNIGLSEIITKLFESFKYISIICGFSGMLCLKKLSNQKYL